MTVPVGGVLSPVGAADGVVMSDWTSAAVSARL